MPSDVKVSLPDYSAAIANTLSDTMGPAIVVGHSLGALIALDLAIRHPQKVTALVPLNAIFRRTITASTTVKKRAHELTSRGNADPTETLERWFGTSSKGALFDARQNCENMLNGADAAGYATAYKVFAESDGPTDIDLNSLKVPMLCVTGSEEPNSTPAMSTALATLAQDGRAVVIDGARHMMPITHATEVNQHIIEFAQSKDLLNV